MDATADLAANNAHRPPVRAQLHPRALEIVDSIEPVIEGYTADGVPRWKGVSTDGWRRFIEHADLLLELIQICRTHFPTACAVLLKVKSKRSGGLIPFIFNRSQVILWNKIAYMVANAITLFLAILKARQIGISTIVLAWEWWNLWRLTDSEVLMVGHEVKLIESFIDTLRRFHEELPDIEGIKPRLRAGNTTARVPKQEIYYADRRTKGVTVVAKNISTRGLSAPNQHYSEFAHYDDPENMLLTLMPMLPPVGSLARKRASIFIETTPLGKNYFYTFWQLAKSGDSDWVSLFLPWTVAEDEYSLEPPAGWKLSREDEALRKKLSHPRQQIDGREVTRAQMYWRQCEMANQGWNEDMFEQEYPGDDETCFLLRTQSVFKQSIRYLQQCVIESERNVVAEFAKRRIDIEPGTRVVRGELKYAPGPGPFDVWKPKKFIPEFERVKDGRLLVWSPPQVGHSYCAGIDTGQGLERDASVGWMLDVTDGVQVAEWHSRHTDLDPFADEMVALGFWYNTALLFQEINSIGRVVMKRMKRVWMYPRVGLEERWDEAKLKAGKYGFMMSDELKEEMVRRMMWFVRERYIKIASSRTLSELSTFEDDDGTYGASSGSNDDCAIAMGLACMAVHQTPKMYAMMTRKRHEIAVPSAFELGLSHIEAPPPAVTDDPRDDPFREMPADIRAIVESQRKQFENAVATNPIRGY